MRITFAFVDGISFFFVQKDGMAVNINKMLGPQVLFQRSTTGFVYGTVAQVLVAIGAVSHVLLQCHVNVVRLFQVVLNGLLRAEVAVAILAVRHGE